MSALLSLQVKWRGLVLQFDNVDPNLATVSSIREAIEERTGVASQDQKLIGITMNKAAQENSDQVLAATTFKAKNDVLTIQLMGTPQIELIEERARELEQLNLSGKTVLNDLSMDSSPATREWKKLQEFSMKASIKFMNNPRPGKKLLILDLDHTLMHFDSKDENVNSSAAFPYLFRALHSPSTSGPGSEACNAMKRPYLEYFLSSVYPHYDIVVWSQTHWKWIEVKLAELGIVPNNNYKICFTLDKSSMFKIPPNGYVKPLQIVWSQYPQWNKTNTLHVDDMERNFILNKQSGNANQCRLGQPSYFVP